MCSLRAQYHKINSGAVLHVGMAGEAEQNLKGGCALDQVEEKWAVQLARKMANQSLVYGYVSLF
jgi:hypothetical protein